MAAPEIVATDEPTPDDRGVIVRGLLAFNDPLFGPSNYRPLAVLLREDGETVGGLWGKTSYDWLYVELLFVPGSLRGQGLGAALMARAEDVARARDCVGVWVDTFDAGARAFYGRQGYEVFGEIKGQPRRGRRAFLKKALLPPSPLRGGVAGGSG